MTEIKNNELEQINGGINWGIAIGGIAAAITFIVGIVDGYVNPTKCNN